MKKLLAALLALLFVVVPVFAGGSSESSKDGTVTISFWDGNWNEPVFAKIQELWNEQHPDIKLQAEFQVENGQFEKYMLAMQNGTAPDVVACAHDWVTTFGTAGLLEPIDSYVEASGLDLSQYVQGAIDVATVDGKLYGLPFRTETYTLFYNKDILAAAGYTEAPKTWDEVLEIAAAVDSDEVAGFGVCGTNFSNFSFQYITMLRSSGQDILTADNSASALDTPVAIQTAELYRKLAEYAPASMLENDNAANRTLFASGKIAMYMSGIYDAPEIIKVNPDLNFACAMVPTANGAERGSILGGWSVAIPKCAQHKDEAYMFMEFLTSPEVAELYTNTFTGQGTPAATFADYPADIIEPNADALAYAYALPNVGSITMIRQAIFDNLSLSLTDTMTPEAAILQCSAQVNEYLSE